MYARTTLAAVVVGMLALSGCAIQRPDTATSPSVSATPSTKPSPSASSSPSPSASAPAASPVPSDPGPVPIPEGTDESTAAPASWSDEELIGACKVAWNDAGRADGWSDYSPRADIQKRGSEWYVAFRARSGDDVRDCLVSGSPSAPSVTVAP